MDAERTDGWMDGMSSIGVWADLDAGVGLVGTPEDLDVKVCAGAGEEGFEAEEKVSKGLNKRLSSVVG